MGLKWSGSCRTNLVLIHEKQCPENKPGYLGSFILGKHRLPTTPHSSLANKYANHQRTTSTAPKRLLGRFQF
jgi:hypothetical protein